MNKILIVAMLFSAVTFTSCDFLDVSDNFNETLKYDSIFHNKRNLERYLWGTAAYFPDEGRIFGGNYTPGPVATDVAFNLYGSTGEFYGMAYVLGELNANNINSYFKMWGEMYKIIRKANTILARMDEAVDLTTYDKREILGYTYFMRAYAYYHILMQHGPVVILGDEVLDTNEDPDYYIRYRATFDSSINYICAEFERAAEFMPAEVPIAFFGRPTQGAAYGLIARLRLIHASPLYNGGAAAKTYFGDWERTYDGINYIQQNYDEERWAVAAIAAKRIIDLNRYKLHTVERTDDTPALPANVPDADFPLGAGGIDPLKSYSEMFNGESIPSRIEEFIWGRMSGTVQSYTKHSFPVLRMGGWNGMGVTQKVIDNYRMADGNTINNSSAEYPYKTDGFINAAKTFSGYRMEPSVHNIYNNREMRFYASIGFSECYWPCSSTSESGKHNQVVTYYMDGTAGKTQTDGNVNNYPITGYVLKKYVHPDDAWEGTGQAVLPKAFPMIRYAEILLSYAEALNNLTRTHTITDELGITHTVSRDVNAIADAFNPIRYRVGLPGLTAEELADPVKMQELFEKERMIEFLYEDRRYFDVRRWGVYLERESEPIMGMNTDGGKSEYYSFVPVNHSRARNRVVDKKMALVPLPLDEVRKAPLLDQNPGWQD